MAQRKQPRIPSLVSGLIPTLPIIDLGLAPFERGKQLAQQRYTDNGFSYGYDFGLALDLFNQYSTTILVGQMQERNYGTQTDSTAQAFDGFLWQIKALCNDESPEVRWNRFGSIREIVILPSERWETAHPHWRENREMNVWGQMIRVKRIDQDYYARALSRIIDITVGPYPTARQALSVARSEAYGAMIDYQRSGIIPAIITITIGGITIKL